DKRRNQELFRPTARFCLPSARTATTTGQLPEKGLPVTMQCRANLHLNYLQFSVSFLVPLLICGLVCDDRSATGRTHSSVADAPGLALVNPSEVGLDPGRLVRLKPLLQEAIRNKQIPGAVVLVLRQGKICFREAFGFRSLQPTSTPMTI